MLIIREGYDETAPKWTEATVIGVAGVGGCPVGWVVVLVSTDKDTEHRVDLCKSFDEILCLKPRPSVIAIDIPIGLLDERVAGGRECDCEARMLLGSPRCSSVFSAPPRAALSARTYYDARLHGLTLQAFGILPKIREVDASMTPSLQQRVYESHPEVAFFTMAGRPMRHRKKSKAGREERLAALNRGADELPVLGADRSYLRPGSWGQVRSKASHSQGHGFRPQVMKPSGVRIIQLSA